MPFEGYLGSGVHPPKEREIIKEKENSKNQDKGNSGEERKVLGETEIEREKINQEENRKSKGM